LDIQVGEHAVDYANVAQKEKLTELQLRVRQLLDQVEQITKEQNYQRVSFRKHFHLLLCKNKEVGGNGMFYAMTVNLQYREERFRQTSESTNQRVLWWSIIQTAVLLSMGYWQMRHLKSFFEAKKLV
jgi:hypothetical protein